MGFDIIEVQQAANIAIRKLSGGGSSGGDLSNAVEINLDDYGIMLYEEGVRRYDNTDTLWETIENNSDIVFVCNMGGIVYKMRPIVFATISNEIGGVSFQLVMSQGQGTDAVMYCVSVVMARDGNSTKVGITMSTTIIGQTQLPGVCLPVVELSRETMTALFSTGTANCTEAETAVFLSAWDASIPVVLRADFEVPENAIKFVQVGYIWSDQDFDGYRFTNHMQNMRARVYPDRTVEFTLEYS